MTSASSHIVPTAAERAAGRLMRAPDHSAADAGNDGAGNETNASGNSDGGAGADEGAGADASTILGEAAADAGAGDGDGNADGQAKAGPDVPEDNGVPDAYELKLTTVNEAGEEVATDLDPALVEAATPLLKEAGLSNEAANKLLPLVPRVQEQLIKQQNDHFAQVRADWDKQTRDDPEIGGNQFAETQRLAAKALDHFTGPAVIVDADGNETPNEFRQLLNDSGLGNHPVMVRAFRKIGAALNEDPNFVRNTTEKQVRRSREEEMYPEDVPNKS